MLLVLNFTLFPKKSKIPQKIVCKVYFPSGESKLITRLLPENKLYESELFFRVESLNKLLLNKFSYENYILISVSLMN